MTNADSSASHFLAHLQSYPCVNDSVKMYKSSRYGSMSLSVATDAYSRFAAPLIVYLKGPMGFVTPYVKKADMLADRSLGRVEERFPIVKEDSSKVKEAAMSYAMYPINLISQGRQYVVDTYNEEYRHATSSSSGAKGGTSSKSGQQAGSDSTGMISSALGNVLVVARVGVNTNVRIASDVLQAMADMMKREQVKAKSEIKSRTTAARTAIANSVHAMQEKQERR